MTSNHHGLYALGYTRNTMVRTKSSQLVTVRESQKPYLSSDRSLQLDSVKSESLVIANQNVAVNTYLGFVHTARHMQKVSFT